MFTVEQRDRARDHVLEMARADARVVAAAAIGASAEGGGDRWSDLDLTFGLADGVSIQEVLDDWTGRLTEDLVAVHLFDLTFLSSVYRVFLLPGCLQVDLSFTPSAEFGALGPRFSLLFGTAVERDRPRPAPARHHLGLAVHHAVRARLSVERGRLWQAEHWIGQLRDHALALACDGRGLEAGNGREYDQLPAEVLDRFADTLVRAVERQELLRALGAAIDALLREAGELAAPVAPRLRDLSPATLV